MTKRNQLLYLFGVVIWTALVNSALLEGDEEVEVYPVVDIVKEKLNLSKRELVNASGVGLESNPTMVSNTSDTSTTQKLLATTDVARIVPKITHTNNSTKNNVTIKTSSTAKTMEPVPVKKSKADFLTKKRESETIRPSILGSMLLYLITVVVAGTLFVMLVCFAHKWKENMGTSVEYPKVEYSMLRQGEDEPEDPLGEILINIGLAAPEDIRPVSGSETEEDYSDNMQSAILEPSSVLDSPLEPRQASKFMRVSLHSDEKSHLLNSSHQNDESDEQTRWSHTRVRLRSPKPETYTDTEKHIYGGCHTVAHSSFRPYSLITTFLERAQLTACLHCLVNLETLPPESGSLDVAGGLACANEPVGCAVGVFGPWQGHPRRRGHWEGTRLIVTPL